ncbi:helix-turn-helix domain-containing protein [Flavobacterium sp. MAH-1]|uniref:Helix-turn-helix domain-containing protein n=1 Tax=Flavobacterium agri TaxID=2743471 RepID=A0A7Y8Y157_9FLAO|nr:AraC family transcriptional regulator [Flavobacterium agri]NUY80511.1 helix-turn-helix domain-containing protein [Flavobacterium agri]NYA70536.1 helix-turn-helix domain-containing protein [Flavobacterium agri]
MKTRSSENGTTLFGLCKSDAQTLETPEQFDGYCVILIHSGQGNFHADFGTFGFSGPTVLFATPTQMVYLKREENVDFEMLRFHSDFYCIEYHHHEIACNGLLFNNIYLEPAIVLTPDEHSEFSGLFSQIAQELEKPSPSDLILQSYLQLILAKSSQVKNRSMAREERIKPKDETMEKFKALLETHFLDLRKPNEYADLLFLTPNNLSKRCRRYFGKTPSQLITERLVLEAKKQLHLTRKSIKEIAYALHFEDEFYFSRVFKKFTHESPQSFRDKTGISIVADLYMK